MNIFEKNWMLITLKSNAKIEATKIYLFEFENREFVDKEFDKLHDQERMKFSFQSTLFDWSIFVIWRIIEKFDKQSERKNRVVIDIRDLNKIIVIDFYSLLLQSDITFLMSRCYYIIVIDVADFFYQWRVNVANRFKLVVVSHRDQEQFNVTIIRFKNFSSYVQRKIDIMLRLFRSFARIYIDDIVIFSKTLLEHLKHLHAIFELLDSESVTLFSKKSFLDHSTIILLDQKIDALDLTAIVDKIAIIQWLDFSYKLFNLEIYLELTSWLREYILFYVQKGKSIQRRKIVLLRMSLFNKERVRKIYNQKTVLKFLTNEKLNSYRQLQEFFTRVEFLIHFDRSRTLYIDVDVSKRRDFEAMIYHLKIETNSKRSRRIDVESILFLSWLLNFAKTRYWSIELEMIDLVWVVKRVRHIIETIAQIVIFIDHVVNSSITRQITLFFSSIDKLNLRLVRAFTDLSQFKLNVKYRLDKKHVISDALSRLSAVKSTSSEIMNAFDTLDLNIFHSSLENLETNQVYAYQDILMIMSLELKNKILNEY